MQEQASDSVEICSLQKDQIKDDRELKEEIQKIKEESARRFKVVVRMLVAIIVLNVVFMLKILLFS